MKLDIIIKGTVLNKSRGFASAYQYVIDGNLDKPDAIVFYSPPLNHSVDQQRLRVHRTETALIVEPAE